MIKKKYGLMLLTGAILLQGGITSFAAESTVGDDSDSKNATSYGHIVLDTIDETETPTDPILPIDPDGNGETDESGETGNTNSLRIDWVTPFEFGTHNVPTTSTTYSLTDRDNDPFVQVSDFRGTGEGWTLQVSRTDFVDGDNILKGAELTLPAGTLSSTGDNTSDAPTSAGTFTVNGVAATVVTAASGEGMGTWANRFAKNDVKLTVPAGNYAGDYHATLTWTLTDAQE